ncbi:MAG TPA: PhoU domain-containing protein, partial [Acidimicrobiales bacterium]
RTGETITTLAGAGDAVLAAAVGETEPDAALADVLATDARVDALLEWLEGEVFDLVARQSPVGRDLRFLTASLRIGQALERVGDLLVSTGRRVEVVRPLVAGHGLEGPLRRLGDGALDLLRRAGAAYAVFDAEAASQLAADDDAVDAAHGELRRQLFSLGEVPAEPVVELSMVGRFFERVADHAVVIGERVCFIASGVMHPGDADESTIWAHPDDP